MIGPRDAKKGVHPVPDVGAFSIPEIENILVEPSFEDPAPFWPASHPLLYNRPGLGVGDAFSIGIADLRWQIQQVSQRVPLSKIISTARDYLREVNLLDNPHSRPVAPVENATKS
jgi:hypothetical protein